jgi:effector-binding domain-containing protein
VTEPEFEERAALPYVGIRREVTDGVPALVDVIFPELFGWLGEHGIAPAGPPFIRVHEVDSALEPLVLEAGAPVAGEVEASDPVRFDELPGGRYLTDLHVGPYRSESETDLVDARAELLRWAAVRDVEYGTESRRGQALACAVDHMRRGPAETADHSSWETELTYLVLSG